MQYLTNEREMPRYTNKGKYKLKEEESDTAGNVLQK